METITLIPPNTTHQFTVLETESGQRLDLYLKQHFPSYSRSFLQQLIAQEMVSINSKRTVKPGVLTKSDDLVSITFPPPTLERPRMEIPEDLDIKVLYKDQHFMVIDKPVNLAVHPPRITSKNVTLIDWLIKEFQNIAQVGYTDRPGIVHRLDKDTSGLLLIACNNCSHAILSDLFRERTIHKIYLAVVEGHPDKEGTIDFSIMRHQKKRNTMIHVTSKTKIGGQKIRNAKTHYRVVEYFENHSLVEVKLVTGRTHQIRVHFSAIGHPLVGDLMYGNMSKLIGRQALHAHKLSFEFNGKKYSFCQNPPEDFKKLLEKICNN